MTNNDDAALGAKLRRYQELNQSRSARLQRCADHISAFNEATRILKDALDSRGDLADVALPKLPEKAAVVETFNDMLKQENECRRLAAELGVQTRSGISYTITG